MLVWKGLVVPLTTLIKVMRAVYCQRLKKIDQLTYSLVKSLVSIYSFFAFLKNIYRNSTLICGR
jgi:uncharacterized membrane protein (GlpM family)